MTNRIRELLVAYRKQGFSTFLLGQELPETSEENTTTVGGDDGGE